MAEKLRLHVVIDETTQIARFSGPGTFVAKETIKSLGPARWIRESLTWEVKPFTRARTDLPNLFREVILEGDLAAGEGTLTAVALVETAEPVAKQEGLSVTELLLRARAAIQQAFPTTVLIYGVVTKVRRFNDRVFLDLSERDRPEECVSCAVWENVDTVFAGLTKAGFSLEPDLDMMFEASVGLDRRNGKVTLAIRRVVVEYTVAKLHALREVTNKRLQSEGLFHRNKELALPFLPRRLGVLTSASGTVINDFMAALDEANFGFEILWLHTSVQGTEARAQIIAGMETLRDLSGLDAILLFRGGGSTADLAIFNDYEVARAICLCPVPVLSAIGHQEDQSSAQDVSHRAFGVPKDLGHYLARIVIDLRRRFSESVRVIGSLLETRTAALERHVVTIGGHIPSLAEQVALRQSERLKGAVDPMVRLAQRSLDDRERFAFERASNVVRTAHHLEQLLSERLEKLIERAATNVDRAIERKEHELSRYEIRISEAAPEVQLRRGFALVRKEDGAVATRKERLKEKDRIAIEFEDGAVRAVVEKL